MKCAPIAVTEVWTRHPRPMLCARRKHRVLAASTNVLRRARSTVDDPICSGNVRHRCAADRYVQKRHIGHVQKFGMEHVWKFGIWARSELGIGHDVPRAFRPGGAIGP